MIDMCVQKSPDDPLIRIECCGDASGPGDCCFPNFYPVTVTGTGDKPEDYELGEAS